MNEAVKNSELWWGEKLTLDILKYSFFPILKYPKIKGTKKSDMTKSPTLGAKVPFYEKDNRWNVELYDTNGCIDCTERSNPFITTSLVTTVSISS